MKEKSLIISTLCVITLPSLLYTNVTCHPNVQAIYLTHACISFFFHETEKEGQFFIRTKIGSLVHNIFRRSRAPAPFLQCANLTSIFCNLSQFRGSFHTLEQTVALVTQLPASPVGSYPFWGGILFPRGVVRARGVEGGFSLYPPPKSKFMVQKREPIREEKEIMYFYQPLRIWKLNDGSAVFYTPVFSRDIYEILALCTTKVRRLEYKTWRKYTVKTQVHRNKNAPSKMISHNCGKQRHHAWKMCLAES